ncbi:MAG TPA: hypothetical protein VFG09_05595 [Thermodesulfovibrionales bacterium]|jgi:hypothetical protein|nr:hypothetical protein [Thermodesulfovibrionales bacterium]
MTFIHKLMKMIVRSDYEGQLIYSKQGPDSGKIFHVNGGCRRWIVCPKTFEKMGFCWEKVKEVPEQVIAKIPQGEPLGDKLQPAEMRHEKKLPAGTFQSIRYNVSSSFLSGHGIEIGAGPNPQKLPESATCEYFDKRNEQELAALFNVDQRNINKTYSLAAFDQRLPNGADFLIAHNVLEHSSNPVKTLIYWNSLIKDGGIAVISIPDAGCCPDKDRILPSAEHLLLDYLLDRDEDTYESREHIYSFIMGWINEGTYKECDKNTVAWLAHDCAHAAAKRNDLHWHAFNQQTVNYVVDAAAHFGDKKITVLRKATPDHDNPDLRTLGDIILIYRVEGGKADLAESAIPNELEKLYKKLHHAMGRLHC